MYFILYNFTTVLTILYFILRKTWLSRNQISWEEKVLKIVYVLSFFTQCKVWVIVKFFVFLAKTWKRCNFIKEKIFNREKKSLMRLRELRFKCRAKKNRRFSKCVCTTVLKRFLKSLISYGKYMKFSSKYQLIIISITIPNT